MAVFKDSLGDEWIVSLNVNTLKRLKEYGFDLAEMINGGEIVEKLHTDPVLLVDMLYLACKSQAEGKGVTDEQFGTRMASSKTINDAADALMEAIASFFGSRGEVMLAAARKMQALQSKVTTRLMQQLEQSEGLEAFDSGEPSTTSPASSELTPAS